MSNGNSQTLSIEQAISGLKAGCPEDSETMKLIKEMAVYALTRLIEVAPIGNYTDFKCPLCGRRVRSGLGSSSRQRDKYCQRCGQTLNWRSQTKNNRMIGEIQ